MSRIQTINKMINGWATRMGLREPANEPQAAADPLAPEGAVKQESAPNGPPTIQQFTPQLLDWNRIAAARYDVEPDVHLLDFIYWWHFNLPQHASQPRVPIDYYFEDGERSSSKLAGIVQSLDLPKGRKVGLLEFASGYGCVSRHLKKNPLFDLVSCDIHPEAIRFLSETLGVKTLQSASEPGRFSPDRTYDVVFALSFFSHMPRSTWGAWVNALFNSLAAPGYLIFTTHGWVTAAQMKLKTLPPDGFWFAPMTEQEDIDPNEYGCTVVSPEFAFAEIRRQTGSLDIRFIQGEWWGLQDLWIVKRNA